MIMTFRPPFRSGSLHPLILGRPFLRMTRALIDVHGEQMTLRHDDQSMTFKVGDTKTFSYNIIESVKRVDVIDIACEEYVQEIDEFLKHDDSIPPGVDGIYDSEGDTVYLEELLPSHLEYAFLEGDDKLPVIIAKNLKDEDKTALIKVLKSHKHAIAWKISDIKGEYHSIRQRASENSTEYMQRFLRLAGFLRKACGTLQKSRRRTFRWGLHKSSLPYVMCYTVYGCCSGILGAGRDPKGTEATPCTPRSTNSGFQQSRAGHLQRDCRRPLVLASSGHALTRSQTHQACLCPYSGSGRHIQHNRATSDCYSRRVIFGDIHAPEFIYHGSLPGKPMKIISALKARTLLSHGCEGFLATIHDTTSDVSSIHDCIFCVVGPLAGAHSLEGTVHRKKKLLMASPDQQWYMDTGATSHLSSSTKTVPSNLFSKS
ncbi:hypothetical protein Tco_1214403 [Tanacetum coccineum]